MSTVQAPVAGGAAAPKVKQGAVSAPAAGKRDTADLPRAVKVTALSLLKHFYDEQIFNLLIRYFYDPDPEVSKTAIAASGSIGNDVAIPHLYRLTEQGNTEQKIAAIRTLAAVNAPPAIDYLSKYFAVFQQTEIRREILKAINRISPLHPKSRELNVAVLMDTGLGKGYDEPIILGLLEAGEFEHVKNNLLATQPEVQRLVFNRILDMTSEESADFVEHFQDKVAQVDPTTLGFFLCAYELKTASPQQNYVVDTLQSVDARATTSFLLSLTNYRGRIQNLSRMFRLLLRVPYIDADTEALNGDLLARIIADVKKDSPLLLNEFIFATATNLEAVFAKIRQQTVSLQGVKQKEALLGVLLAKTLEQYGTAELLQEAAGFFKIDTNDDPGPLVTRIRERMITAGEDERNRFEATRQLFDNYDRSVRLNTYHTLAKVNLSNPALMRRLNRLIRVIGTLDIRNSGKKILEIFNYSRLERIPYLEETCVVTLCQLLNRTAIEQAKNFFAEPAKNAHAVAGYVRGARYLPPKLFLNPVLRLLGEPKAGVRIHGVIINSLEVMDLGGVGGVLPPLIKALRLAHLSQDHKRHLSAIIARYGDSSVLQPLIELTASEDVAVRRLGIRTIRDLVKRERNLPIDVLTSRLYTLLEDKLEAVRIDALLALLALRDDYAIQVLQDFFDAQDETAIVEVLGSLDSESSHEVIARVLSLIFSENARIHEELRVRLEPFCAGSFAEEIRNTLLGALKGQGTRQLSSGAVKKVAESRGGGLLGHAKADFKLRRENAQELTVFFTDIVSYTKKTSASDASGLLNLIASFEEITVPTIERLKGTVVKKMGDGLLATFKHPLNAAIAALQIQKKIEEHNEYKMEAERFQVRVGLNTGSVIGKGDDIFGDTVNVASRMETSARPGEVLLTQGTYEGIKEHVRCTHLGPLQVKGKAEAIATYAAEEILIDVDKLLTEGGAGAPGRSPKSGVGSLAELQESMFEPQFSIPEASGLPSAVAAQLEGVFADLARAVESVSEDYHQEYLFKRFLQERWDRMVGTAAGEKHSRL